MAVTGGRLAVETSGRPSTLLNIKDNAEYCPAQRDAVGVPSSSRTKRVTRGRVVFSPLQSRWRGLRGGAVASPTTGRGASASLTIRLRFAISADIVGDNDTRPFRNNRPDTGAGTSSSGPRLDRSKGATHDHDTPHARRDMARRRRAGCSPPQVVDARSSIAIARPHRDGQHHPERRDSDVAA